LFQQGGAVVVAFALMCGLAAAPVAAQTSAAPGGGGRPGGAVSPPSKPGAARPAPAAARPAAGQNGGQNGGQTGGQSGGQAGATTGSFPGGALSLRETHGDWLLTCSVDAASGRKSCVVSQEQSDAKSRQRVLMLQIKPDGPGGEGLLILPFGLLLENGATLRVEQVANVTPGAPPPPQLSLKIRTCLPVGCVAPFALDAATLGAVRLAKQVTITARAAETSQDVSFKVSPAGFGSAYDRAAALLR
jgi:invasion protein IalB